MPSTDAGIIGQIIAETVFGEWSSLTREQRMVCVLAGARVMQSLVRDYEFSTEFDWKRVERDEPSEPSAG